MREFSHIALLRFFGKHTLFFLGFMVRKKTACRPARWLVFQWMFCATIAVCCNLGIAQPSPTRYFKRN